MSKSRLSLSRLAFSTLANPLKILFMQLRSQIERYFPSLLRGISFFNLVFAFIILVFIPISFGLFAQVVSHTNADEHIGIPQLNTVINALFASFILALSSASLAVAWGAVQALAVRLLPRKIGLILDFLILSPIAFPPVIIGGAYHNWVLWGEKIYPFNLFLPDNFFGISALICTYTVSLTPLNYFCVRAMLSRIRPELLDSLNLLGFHGWELFKIMVLPRLSTGISLGFFLTFALVVSDPLTPTFLGGNTLNAAELAWLQVSAFGNHRMSALLSLAFLVPWGIIVLVLIYKFKRSPLAFFSAAEQKYQENGKTQRRFTLSRPVGSQKNLFLLIPVVFYIFFVGFAEAMIFTKGWKYFHTLNFQVIGNTLVFALIATILALILAFSGVVWRKRTTLVDLLFLLVSFIPPAALGGAYYLLYGDLRNMYTSAQTLLIILTNLSIAAPLTYFSILALGALISSSTIEAAAVLGASPLRIAYTLFISQLRQYFGLTLMIVTIMSTVMTAPLMWLVNSDVPIVLPRLYRLLDHAQYGPAFAVVAVMFLINAIFLGISLSGLGPRFKRGKKKW